MVETQLYKLRDTLDTLIGRACAMFQFKCDVCELHTPTIWLLILSFTSFMVGRSRVMVSYFVQCLHNDFLKTALCKGGSRPPVCVAVKSRQLTVLTLGKLTKATYCCSRMIRTATCTLRSTIKNKLMDEMPSVCPHETCTTACDDG